MHIAALALTSLLFLAATGGFSTVPDAGGFEALGSNRSSYRLHTYRTTWDMAFMICQSERAHLVVIDSPAESNTVKKLFQRVLPLHPPLAWHFDVLHVGITNKGPKGIWFGVLGGPVSESGYNVWRSGLPNNRNKTEQCGAIARNGEYYHVRCDDRENPMPFICEK